MEAVDLTTLRAVNVSLVAITILATSAFDSVSSKPSLNNPFSNVVSGFQTPPMIEYKP